MKLECIVSLSFFSVLRAVRVGQVKQSEASEVRVHSFVCVWGVFLLYREGIFWKFYAVIMGLSLHLLHLLHSLTEKHLTPCPLSWAERGYLAGQEIAYKKIDETGRNQVAVREYLERIEMMQDRED